MLVQNVVGTVVYLENVPWGGVFRKDGVLWVLVDVGNVFSNYPCPTFPPRGRVCMHLEQGHCFVMDQGVEVEYLPNVKLYFPL